MTIQRLVVIEGPDGVGKTSLLNRLKNKFPEADFHTAITNSPIGKFIRQALAGQVALTPRQLQSLMTADRTWRTFESPGVGFLDRWTLSALVYGALNFQEDTPGYRDEIAWLESVNAAVADPSLYIVLMAPVDVLQRRLLHRPNGIEIYETPEILERVVDRYKGLGAAIGAVFVDATGTEEDVFEAVLAVLAQAGITTPPDAGEPPFETPPGVR